MAFSYYKTVTIDHTKVPSTQTNFPVLVSVTDADLKTVGNGGYVQNSSGYDIGFYSDSGLTTKLDWETERYIATTGEVVYWVRIASLSSSTDTVFYMAFGDSGISTDQSNKTGVWDSNFKGVWHLPDGTTLGVTDSTSNANNGTNSGATATTGKIDGGMAVTGGQYFSVPLGAGFPWTLSAWIKPSGTSGHRGFWGAPYLSTAALEIRLVDGNNKINILHSNVSSDYTSSGSASSGSWTKVDVTVDGSGNFNVYINGALDGSYTNATAFSQTSTFIGVRNEYGEFFEGSIDDPKISDSVRSANWITAEYNNQSSPSTFEAFGARTAVGGGGSGKPWLHYFSQMAA